MHYSITTLLTILVILIFISAFFSGSEIGMMSLNRYRLRHMARKKDKKALRVEKLLANPDKLLGVILIGNTLANIIASAVATLIGQRLYGDPGVAVATGLLTFAILIFAEMTPKTLAAIYPQRVAFSVSFILYLLLKLLSPFVWLSNRLSNGLLRLFGVKIKAAQKEHLTHEELATVLTEAGNLISSRSKNMLLSILDLEAVTIDDIMVPRNEVIGIDLNDSWDEIKEQLETAQHTRIPLYTDTINEVKGIIHARTLLNLILEERFDKGHLLSLAEKPYFILEGATLYQQLYDFQKKKRRIGFVVDEYGEILGLVTLEDILEEIVGEFTTDMASHSKDITLQKDGSYLVDGSTSIRDLNRVLKWQVPGVDVKTLNGLITEILGDIPPPQSCLRISNYSLEILLVKDNMVKMVKVSPLKVMAAS